MPVLITGMHRSGTSMVARLLNLCGLYLGSEESLLKPAKDNPDGYWESAEIVKINDELLQFGGRDWRGPAPTYSPDFSKRPEIAPFRYRAQKALQPLRSQSQKWGWKDPRTCLTLSFWRELVSESELKLIVCVRNPLDVIASMEARGQFEEGIVWFRIWQSYYRSLQKQAEDLPILFTHYDTFFFDGAAELDRLSKWAGLHVSRRTLKEACTFIKPVACHHRATWSDMVLSEMPLDVAEYYLELSDLCGGIYSRYLRANRSKPGGYPTPSDIPQSLDKPRIIDLLSTRLYQAQECLKQLTRERDDYYGQLKEAIQKLAVPLPVESNNPVQNVAKATTLTRLEFVIPAPPVVEHPGGKGPSVAVDEDAEQKVGGYWDKYYNQWGTANDLNRAEWFSHPLVQEHHQKLVRNGLSLVEWVIKKYLGDRKPLKYALGVGVGGASFELELLHTNRVTYFDLYDTSQVSGQAVLKQAEALGLAGRVKFHLADINEVELPANHYSLVTFISSLHHVEKLEPVLQSVRDSLCPGGILFANEYVGPDRFDFPAEDTDLARRLYRSLDKAFKCPWPELPQPDPVAVALADPTEAVHSGQILEVLSRQFSRVDFTPLPNCLVPVIWYGLNHDALFETIEGLELVKTLLETDLALVSSQRLPPYFGYIGAFK